MSGRYDVLLNRVHLVYHENLGKDADELRRSLPEVVLLACRIRRRLLSLAEILDSKRPSESRPDRGVLLTAGGLDIDRPAEGDKGLERNLDLGL